MLNQLEISAWRSFTSEKKNDAKKWGTVIHMAATAACGGGTGASILSGGFLSGVSLQHGFGCNSGSPLFFNFSLFPKFASSVALFLSATQILFYLTEIASAFCNQEFWLVQLLLAEKMVLISSYLEIYSFCYSYICQNPQSQLTF